MKNQLLLQLKALLDARLAAAQTAMEAAQNSANEEGKSSAGDKYETARAMAQLDRDMHARQYETARHERQLLERLDPAAAPTRVVPGALVRSSAGLFFVAVSAGPIEVAGQRVLVVSASSPVGKALTGREVGEGFLFQNQPHMILEIG